MNRAPKFSKIELLIRDNSHKDPLFKPETRIEFLDCGLMITGDYIIVIVDEKDDINNSLTSTGRIFSLRDVSSYKTHSI